MIKENPIDVLEKQIQELKLFLSDLDIRKGIPNCISQSDVDKSKDKYKNKIDEFVRAIEVLREHLNLDCEHTPMEYGQLTVCSKCNKML